MTPLEAKVVETLYAGGHQPNSKMCVMEAAAYVAGEKWSDHPSCVSPLLGAFLRSWNDAILDDKARTDLLAPLIPLVLGTTKAGDNERSRLAWEWLCREFVPAWLDLVPSLQGHARTLRDCPIEDILPKLLEAKKDSYAAGAAAGDAAWAAAWAAARAAAGAAAGAAVRDALKPMTAKLQASVVELVKRMAAVEERTYQIKRPLRINGYMLAVERERDGK